MRRRDTKTHDVRHPWAWSAGQSTDGARACVGLELFSVAASVRSFLVPESWLRFSQLAGPAVHTTRARSHDAAGWQGPGLAGG